MTDTDLLSVDQFARALGVTQACIRRWLLERKINSVKLGRLVRIPYTDVQRLIDLGFRPARKRASSRRKSRTQRIQRTLTGERR
jgi:excisionase family DNA binding protein